MKHGLIVMAIFAVICANAQPPAVNFDPFAVTTIAGPVNFMGPVDAAGNIFVVSGSSIKRINPGGTITTIAGTGVAGYVDGPGATAQFDHPTGLALDAAGNIFVADQNNHAIRKITPDGLVSTLAGSYVDGSGNAARFNGPSSVTVDVAGNLFVADGYYVLKVTPAGVVSIFASLSLYSNLVDITIDLQGNLYVRGGEGLLLKITPAGVVTSVGLAPPNQGGFMLGITVDKLGNIYVINNKFNAPIGDIIYKIFPSSASAPIAGSYAGYKDATGPEAQFFGSRYLSVDPAGNNIYVSEANDIRKISKPVLSFTTNTGVASSPGYFNISGNYLTGSVNLQAPAGYELALADAGPYSSTLTVAPVSGEVHVLKIFIRLAAGIAEGTYNDSVVLSSGGAITQKLGVAGIVSHMPKKLVIIGSGTSACVGLDPATACYVGKVSSNYNKFAPPDTSIDNHLARGSTNCYNGMPSSYISPYGSGSIYAPIKDINITAALALNPDAVLVNYPTQAYDVLSISEIMFCLRTIRDSANKKGVPCYITTTQPRTSPASFNTPAIKLKLAALKDSILAVFGNFAIDFWTGLVNPADSSLLYDQGDQTNINPTGHTILAQLVITRNVFGGVVLPVGTGTGVKADYFNGIDLSSAADTRIDPVINNNFANVSPDPGIVNADNYSVRWTGQVQPLYDETYTFYTNTDNGVRLWVNGVLLIDSWVNQPVSEKSGAIALAGGQKYDIRMEYYHTTGNAVSKLLWSSATTPKAIIPTTQLYLPFTAVIPPVPMCTGNTLPANGSTIATQTTATLTWQVEPNITSYDVYLWSGATVPALPTINIAGQVNTTYNATGLTAGTLYNWYVVPRNATGAATTCGIANKTTFTTAAATTGNQPPVSVAGIDALITLPSSSVTLDASGSYDPDGNIKEYYWFQATGPVPSVIGNNFSKFTTATGLTAPGKYIYVLQVTDNLGIHAYSQKVVTVNPAGTVAIPSCVTNTSPINGSTLTTQTTATLTWQASSPAIIGSITVYDVYLQAGTGTPTQWVAPTRDLTYSVSGLTPGTTYSWYVEPRGGFGDPTIGAATGCETANKTTFTTAAAPAGNQLPVSVAGSDLLIVLPVSSVTLDASASYDPDGSITEYYWFQAQGPVPSMIGNNFSKVTVATGLTTPGTYIYVLQVTDDVGVHAYSQKVVTVNADGTVTVSNGGPDAMITQPASSVTLDGSASTGNIVQYYWFQAQGPVPSAIGDHFSKVTTATGLTTPGTYIYVLQVIDNNGVHAYSQKLVTVRAEGTRVMDASAQTTLATASPSKAGESSSLPSVTAVISPNPVATGSLLKLQINSNKAGMVIVDIVSSNGVIVGSKKVNLVAGINNTNVNTYGLAQGFHVIRITGSDKPLNLKLVIQ